MAACVLLLLPPLLAGVAFLNDPFHHGEYFAAASAFFAREPVAFVPLTIHGALDFLPALLARAAWGASDYLLPTRALYQALDLLAALAVFGMVYEATRARAGAVWMLVAAAIVAPAAAGVRDAMLALSLYVFTLRTHREWSARRTLALQVLQGAVLAFALFWSFDRGIAGVAAIGVATIVLARQGRPWRALLAAFVVTVALAGFAFPPFSLPSYLENVRVLMASWSQWRYEWSAATLEATALAVALNAVALWAYLERLVRGRVWRARLADIAAYGVATAFMLRIGTNRMDLDHLHMTLWMPMLLAAEAAAMPVGSGKAIRVAALVAFGAATVFAWQQGIFTLVVLAAALVHAACGDWVWKGWRPARALFAGLVALGLVRLLYLTAANVSAHHYDWLAALARPPANAAAATDGVRWAAQRLRQAQVACVFDLSNSGVINALVDAPACSRFSLPVYAGPGNEHELVAALREKRPPAIVYSSAYWFYAIDGRTMRARFPTLDAFIRSRYAREECNLGYCIRYSGA